LFLERETMRLRKLRGLTYGKIHEERSESEMDRRAREVERRDRGKRETQRAQDLPRGKRMSAEKEKEDSEKFLTVSLSVVWRV
jgi:hypothetical protein